jgi:hypothetical protein
VTPAARDCLAELVGPRKHRRAAYAEDERRRRVAELLDSERDAVRLDRHHAPALTIPGRVK